ncbi:hypothetical protein N9H45_01095 [Opitutales bacterium]|nr:hypothetical protein [Opitutales bacterium]
MQNNLLLLIFFLLQGSFVLAETPPLYPVQQTPRKLTPLMERELKGCFDFFWEEWNNDPKSPTYGMTNGDYIGIHNYVPLAIEEQGFYFTAIIIGVERGWISPEEGEKRIIITLKTLRDLKRINGFWYHFIDPYTGKRGWKDSHNIELSNASAGTMLLGALAAAEYFGGEIDKLTYELYEAMDWKWFTNPVTKHPYLACYPEDLPKNVPHGINKEGMFGGWSAYSEHIFLYILAAGAPREEFSTGADPYYAMKTYEGSYKGEKFIFCGTGAAFTYQWTHAFIDFRNLRDKLDRNWFDNSRHAALAARQYAIDNADRIKGLGPNSWGMSACISPSTGYSGAYGSYPIGAGYKLLEDGTVAPYGALSFLPFTPKESIDALNHMYQIPGLVGEYGLHDAYSYVTKANGDLPWIGKSYLGIDKGLVLLMFENYSTQLIWKLLHQNKSIQKGLKRLAFRKIQ